MVFDRRIERFGCGAFRNDEATKIAGLYKQVIEDNLANIDVIAFAIYNAGLWSW